ncbi:MAG TPA: cysteine-rich CWC family protein [Puia sp.]|nr:cysteine-rich CWC family protein [Puia sp.]
MCQHETKSCGRCNAPFECKVGNITLCQCNGITFTDQEKQYIAGNYTDCLCRDCLLAIKKEFKHRPVQEKMDIMQALSKTR